MVVCDVPQPTLLETAVPQQPEAPVAGRKALPFGVQSITALRPDAVAEPLPASPRAMMEHGAASVRRVGGKDASGALSGPKTGGQKWFSDELRKAARSRVPAGRVAAARPPREKGIGKRQ